jgi:hypothetical protein
MTAMRPWAWVPSPSRWCSGVLPVLVDQSVGIAVVDEVAVLLQAAIGEYPVDGTPCVRLQALRERRVDCRLVVGVEQDEERGGVDGP